MKRESMQAIERKKLQRKRRREVLRGLPSPGWETFAAKLDYCEVTGVFTRRSNGRPAGTQHSDGRRYIGLGSKLYAEHRLAWLYVHKTWPVGQIDHIDGNPGNNRIANLRDVSDVVNKQNMRRSPTGKKYSHLFGAQWCKQAEKWKASIRVNGRTKFIGFFESDVEASAAYLETKRKLHEGCTI